MKLEGRITLLINRGYTTIEVRDEEAGIVVVSVKLTPDQLSRALSREAYVECELETGNLENVGKIRETKVIDFEIDQKLRYSRDVVELKRLAEEQLTSEWVTDGHFDSQGTFFTRDGKWMARATVRRWVNRKA